MVGPVDEPIKVRQDDELGRVPLALEIAGEIRSFDASNGMVFGVVGPWGSGKTSLLNLVAEELGKPQGLQPAIQVINFNPWMFSGADQLMEHFFTELAAELRVGGTRFAKIADSLQGYGQVLAPLSAIPVFGAWAERAKNATDDLKALVERRKGGLSQQRKALEAELRKLEQPIMVVLDDIDRLQIGEIQEVFKLVRLTARFPKIIYVLAFDRVRVEQALSEVGFSGRDYLEKIVQVLYDLPAAPETLFQEQIFSTLNSALEGLPYPLAQSRWDDVFVEIILPLLRTPRDVRRYAAGVRGVLKRLDGRVETVDVLALEAVRMFLPDLFTALTRYRRVLTEPIEQPFAARRSPTEERPTAAIQPFLAAAGEQQSVVTALIRRVFPVASTHIENQNYGSDSAKEWFRKRRVAHRDVLAYYLEQYAGQTIRALWIAEDAFALLANAPALNKFLAALDPVMRRETIQTLEAFQDEYPLAAVVPASIVLLSFTGSLPDTVRSFFPARGDIIIERVVLRLLRRLSNEHDREQAVVKILDQLSSLSQRELLISLVGYEENLGERLISEGLNSTLELSLLNDMREVSPSELAREPRFIRLLIWSKKAADRYESPLVLPITDREFARAVIKGAVGIEWSRGLDTRHVRSRARFGKDLLVFLFGDEAVISGLLRACGPLEGDEELAEAVRLGWAALEPGGRAEVDDFDD
jgi:energy-coupling factor transporter ATP-binding protein EcfA2